jgi:UDP-4-amino-4,6-dideoxy-N-acetyl-beta-L-altrosamine N-acetyltransferase
MKDDKENIIETRQLYQRDITESDLEILHGWRECEVFHKNCSVRRGSVSFEEFSCELGGDFRRDRFKQLIAFRKKNNQPSGTIWAYSLNLIDGYVFITTFVDPQFEKSGYGVELFAAMMNFLFEKFPSLYKIYTEVYSYNIHSVSIMKKFGFVEEGVFRNHRLFDSNRYDLYRLAFYRDQFNSKLEFINRILLKQDLKFH